MLLLTTSLCPVLFSVVLFLSYITFACVCDQNILQIRFGLCARALVILLGCKLFRSHIRLDSLGDVDILQVLLGICSCGLLVLSAIAKCETTCVRRETAQTSNLRSILLLRFRNSLSAVLVCPNIGLDGLSNGHILQGSLGVSDLLLGLLLLLGLTKSKHLRPSTWIAIQNVRSSPETHFSHTSIRHRYSQVLP